MGEPINQNKSVATQGWFGFVIKTLFACIILSAALGAILLPITFIGAFANFSDLILMISGIAFYALIVASFYFVLVLMIKKSHIEKPAKERGLMVICLLAFLLLSWYLSIWYFSGSVGSFAGTFSFHVVGTALIYGVFILAKSQIR
jgi:hypothetical protein